MEGEGCGAAAGVAVDSGNPLLKAVFLRRLRLTRLLLEGGAYINESDGQGLTPLMVACRTRHADAQSASRLKLVQFLLEKGADPNIQDKEGRSALMHACQEQAGTAVVALLLANGADVGLEDRSGTSALVYSVMAGDWTVLKLLLDTCKAKGKEVIIINTDKLPCGKLQAKQYLGVPPLGVPPLGVPPLGALDRTPDRTTPAAPASPSDIQLMASPQSSSSSLCPPKPVFSFKEGVSSHPCSPSRLRGLSHAAAAANGLQQQPLLRLNSEPWLKIPSSLLAGHQQQQHQDQQQQHQDQQKHHGASSPHRSQNFNQSEDLSFRVPRMDGFKWYEGRLARSRGADGADKDDCAEHPGEKMSLPGLVSPHSASHPNLHSEHLSSSSSSSSWLAAGGRNHGAPLYNVASSSLHSIIQRRKLGADIYSSDPQLAVDVQTLPEEQRAEVKRLAPLRCSSTLGSRESGPNRRMLSGLERRGSGAFLLDHSSSQARPRSLPPLTLNSSNDAVLNACSFGAAGSSEREAALKHFLPSAPPGQPRELSRRMLLRRHSMQTEQFKTSA